MDRDKDVADLINAAAITHRHPALRNHLSEQTKEYCEQHGIQANSIEISPR